MAWIRVAKQGQKSKSGRDADGNRTATEVYVVESDAPTTTVAAETASYGGVTIPVEREAHGDDSTRRVVSVDAVPEEESGRKIFTVTVQYSNKALGAVKDPNPLVRAAVVDWDFGDKREPYFFDRTPDEEGGPKPCVNSSGERFQELLERDTGEISAVIEKNVAPSVWNPITAAQLQHTLNKDSITVDGATVLAGQAKCRAWVCGPIQTENGVSFRVSRVYLQFKESWDDVIEDRGFHELNASVVNGGLIEIVKGTPPTKPDSPWPLNGHGRKMPNPDDEPAKITRKPYTRKAWTGLPLV